MLLDGKAPLPGQVMKFPNLAQTFKELAVHGKDGFYKGRIAESIVDVVKSNGGLMELDDLENHQSTFVEAIKYTYGNVTVHEVSLCLQLAAFRDLFTLTISVLLMARELLHCWL